MNSVVAYLQLTWYSHVLALETALALGTALALETAPALETKTYSTQLLGVSD